MSCRTDQRFPFVPLSCGRSANFFSLILQRWQCCREGACCAIVPPVLPGSCRILLASSVWPLLQSVVVKHGSLSMFGERCRCGPPRPGHLSDTSTTWCCRLSVQLEVVSVPAPLTSLVTRVVMSEHVPPESPIGCVVVSVLPRPTLFR